MVRKLASVFLFVCIGVVLTASNHGANSLYETVDSGSTILSFLVNKDVSEVELDTALKNIDQAIDLKEYRALSHNNLPTQNVCAFNMASIVVANASQAEAVSKLDSLSEAVSWVPSSTEGITRLSGGGFGSTQSSSHDIKLQSSASRFTGQGIRIAVLDTGFTKSQWVLDDWQNANAIKLTAPLNLTSDDPTAIFDGFVSRQDSSFDYVGHGTAIAALSAANHPELTAGASNAEVMPIKVCNDEGDCLSTHVIQGLCHALNSAPWTNGRLDLSKLVINMSFGTPDASKGIYDVLEYALANGASVVVSAGNNGESGSTALYPAAFGAQNRAGFAPLQGLIVVAALEAWGGNFRPAAFSTRGDFVDLAVLGTNVLSSNADSLSFSASFSGTSFAAPQVSSVVAQLKEALPHASPLQLENLLKETATWLNCASCNRQSVGAGLLNLEVLP